METEDTRFTAETAPSPPFRASFLSLPTPELRLAEELAKKNSMAPRAGRRPRAECPAWCPGRGPSPDLQIASYLQAGQRNCGKSSQSLRDSQPRIERKERDLPYCVICLQYIAIIYIYICIVHVYIYICRTMSRSSLGSRVTWGGLESNPHLHLAFW